MRFHNLAAKTLLGVLVSGTTIAGMPVIDGANLIENKVAAIENIAQTTKQIQQYRTQLQQYENMLLNTTAPSRYIWADAQRTITALRGEIDTLNYYKRQLGDTDTYLNQFRDLEYYRTSRCAGTAGCAEADRFQSEAVKRANDALLRGVDQQQDQLQADAEQLNRLQSEAQGATGQLQAIQFANQLASSQTNQLLQIRAALLAQQNAETVRAQAVADREAREKASSEYLRGTNFVPSKDQYESLVIP